MTADEQKHEILSGAGSRTRVQNGFNFDALLDELAERVAARLRLETAQAGNGSTIRPRLLSIEEAAIYLGRSKEAMQHLAGAGKIPTVRADRRIFIDVQDLNRWIEQNKEQPMK